MTFRIIFRKQPQLARSFSFFWFQRIYIDPGRYNELPSYARRAMIAHECSHLAGHDTEWRILAALCPLLWPFLGVICRWQEYRADDDAAHHGHARGMLRLLERDTAATFTHPKNMDRRNKLLHTL